MVSNVAAKLSAVWSVIGPTLAFGGGVVHRDIETAKPCDGLIDHGADIILLADVGVDELGLRTERAQLLNERLAGLITPTGNDHLRALLGEGDGGGAPDAGKPPVINTTGLLICNPRNLLPYRQSMEAGTSGRGF